MDSEPEIFELIHCVIIHLLYIYIYIYIKNRNPFTQFQIQLQPWNATNPLGIQLVPIGFKIPQIPPLF